MAVTMAPIMTMTMAPIMTVSMPRPPVLKYEDPHLQTKIYLVYYSTIPLVYWSIEI